MSFSIKILGDKKCPSFRFKFRTFTFIRIIGFLRRHSCSFCCTV